MKLLKNCRLKKIFILSLIFCTLISCESTKNIVYFQNANDLGTDVNVDTFESRFKIGDIVSIYVSTFDMEAASPFNLSAGGSISNRGTGRESAEGGGPGLDYLIGKDGSIDFPVIGKVKLVGLTIEEAKQLLIRNLKEYLKDPIVNIRIKNFRITILGAVNNPGTYTVDGERITILQALGMAGDLHIKGLRENVLVIRDFSGAKTYTRIDLTNKNITESPAYYLTQNDVIYVEPNKSLRTASSLDARVSILISVLSLAITTSVIIITRR